MSSAGPEEQAGREETGDEQQGHEQQGHEQRRVQRGRLRRSALGETVLLAVVGIAAALLARAFVVQAFYIPSGSMERTLHGCEGCSGNDRVLVDKLSYRFGSPSRGDIVVFDTKDTPYAQEGGEKDVIKRVIGLPGDVVACCDSRGRVTVNGSALREPYVFEDNRAPFGPVRVPEGRLWLMGDHRSDSQDSRAVGSIPEANVVGKAFVRYWPLDRIGGL